MERPRGIGGWLRLYRLYRQAFPASERKPFSIMVKMYRRGKTDLWSILRGGRFVGLAITINGKNAILLDYFAVEKSCRGMGIGSAALGLLRRAYVGRGVFLEIESVWEDAPDLEQRRKRKAFYLANGMEPMNVMVRLFGVKMELLGWDCRLDFSGYRAFYRDNYSPWAAERISEEIHPDAGRS